MRTEKFEGFKIRKFMTRKVARIERIVKKRVTNQISPPRVGVAVGFLRDKYNCYAPGNEDRISVNLIFIGLAKAS
jgi:hypothetical protein